MIEDPIGAAGREAKRREVMGEGAVCVTCGEPRLFALRQIEQHHVAGKNHAPSLMAPLCLNCHAVAHESYRRVGVKLEAQPDFLERLVAVLAAVGAFLIQLGEALLAWSRQLAARTAGLELEGHVNA